MVIEMPTYDKDPYREEITTSVLATGEDSTGVFCVLADTVLYPEGGGQPSDHGTVGGIEVVDVRKVEGETRHYVAAAVTEPTVAVVVDWQRRFDHMQQHTAQHLLSAIALSDFGWATTSFHLGEHRCDIELDTSAIDPGSMQALEERVRAAIRAGRPVSTRHISHAEFTALDLRGRGLPSGHQGEVRLVEIADFDITTCGGTHLRSTAEIESILLGPTEPMRGGTRLFWLAGARMGGRLRHLEALSAQLRQLLETSEAEIVSTAELKLDGLKEATQTLRRLSTDLAEARAATLATSRESFVEAHFDNRDAGFLSQLAKSLLAQSPEKVALLTASQGEGHAFLIAAGADAAVPLQAVGPRIAALLGGRGGGSHARFQGKAGSLDRRAEAVDLLTRELAL